MSMKTFTYRYDSNSDIAKWLANQNNKTGSFDAVIRTIGANFGDGDYLNAVLSQVNVNLNGVPKSVQREEKIVYKMVETSEKKPVSKPKPKETKDKNDDDEDGGSTTLDMMSSL